MKRSGSNIHYFDVNVAFYVFMCFLNSPLNSAIFTSDVSTFQLIVPTADFEKTSGKYAEIHM